MIGVAKDMEHWFFTFLFSIIAFVVFLVLSVVSGSPFFIILMLGFGVLSYMSFSAAFGFE